MVQWMGSNNAVYELECGIMGKVYGYNWTEPSTL